MTASRTTFLFTALGLLTAALFIADLAVGSVAVPLGDVWAALTGGSCDPATSDIILKIRLLKAVTALFAGAALAAGGLEMQTLFRNPLAGPYVLGVSSGAGLASRCSAWAPPAWASRDTHSSGRWAWPGLRGSARRSCWPS